MLRRNVRCFKVLDALCNLQLSLALHYPLHHLLTPLLPPLKEQQRLRLEEETRRKVAGRTFARGFLAGLFDSVVEKLYASGYFYDPIQREVEEEVMPSLLAKAMARITKDNVARQVQRWNSSSLMASVS